MSDINQVRLRGRAGGDAEVKTLPNATLVTVRIATGESYTDRSGSKVDRTDWHLVACWGKVAEQATGSPRIGRPKRDRSKNRAQKLARRSNRAQ